MIEVELPTTPKEIKAATDEVLKQIEKDHGKGAIIRMNEQVGKDTPHIPTGLIPLDNDVLGIGGMPKGRMVEIFGPESSGKTTLALAVIAAVQRAGGQAAIIDAEHALDPNWASLNGVDMDKLLVSQPDYGEQALQIVEALLGSGAFGVIVVDSVAALVPKSELEGEIGESSMGVQARMMSQACRKLTGLVAKSGTILIFINQIRDKIGVMFGSPETTTGGKALKFYTSVRLDVRKIGAIKDGDAFIGNKVRIKAVKNKVGKPFCECEVDLMFDSGFNATALLLDAAVAAGVVEKSGSWYSLNGERMGQGKNGALAYINSTNKSEEILAAINAKKGAQ